MMLSSLVCVCLGLFFTSAKADCSLTDYALEFLNRDVNDYVQIWGMPNLTEFTVCFWMKSNDSNSGTPFSYAIPEENNELLIINYSNLEVWMAGHATGGLSVSANDGKWHHICTSWENTAGSLQLYKDGALAASTTLRAGHVIRSAGSLVLGQDQDFPGGGFESGQSFHGLLANLNMWNYVLCPNTIARMAKTCLSTWVGNLYRWYHFQAGIEGQIKLLIPSPCSPMGN